MNSLKDLIGEERDFFEKFFEKKAFYLSGKTDKFKELISEQDINELLFKYKNHHPYFKVAKGGTTLNKSLYCMPNSSLIDPEKFVSLYSKGCSLILANSHDLLKKLGAFTVALSSDLYHRVGANLYITPPDSFGFPAHYDTHDVIILQVKGEKLWQFYENDEELPNTDMPWDLNFFELGQTTNSIKLKEGDLLYIPRGVSHKAVCTDKGSIHITLGLFGSTIKDVIVDAIEKASKKNIFLRKSYPTFEESDIGIIKEILNEVVNNTYQNKLLYKKEFNHKYHLYNSNFFIETLKNDFSTITKFKLSEEKITIETCEDKNNFSIQRSGEVLELPNEVRELISIILKFEKFSIQEILKSSKQFKKTTIINLVKHLLIFNLIKPIDEQLE